MTNCVAVYGTLRKGQGSNLSLQGCSYLGTERISGFNLYHLGGFPTAIKGDGFITVEVYQIHDKRVWNTLDRYEGYPDFYQKIKIESTLDDDVSIYYMEDNQRAKANPQIVSGDWTDLEGLGDSLWQL